jgi:3-dehydroquinate dehydratase-1
MLKLGTLELGGIPRIAVVYSDSATSELIAESKRRGVDIAEVRIDHFERVDPSYVRSVLARFEPLPTIATIRIREEGGSWAGTEEERLGLFRSVIPLVDAVDVELRANTILGRVCEHARGENKCVVVSYHDFVATPDLSTLEQIAEDASRAGADIIKIATHARSDEDIQSLASFCINNTGRNLIVIALGDHGSKSRLFLPSLGSLVTFASMGKPSAPGQLEYEQTFELMRLFYPEFNEQKRAELGLRGPDPPARDR